jgi:NADH-quinone oxidoreductase subunit J
MSTLISLYCLLIIITAFVVVFSSNIMISILFLILIFILVAFLYIAIGVEFLAVLIFIVYVGAIAILFLFVIMLLHVRTVVLYNSYLNYLPIGAIIGFLILFEFFYFSIFVYSANDFFGDFFGEYSYTD